MAGFRFRLNAALQVVNAAFGIGCRGQPLTRRGVVPAQPARGGIAVAGEPPRLGVAQVQAQHFAVYATRAAHHLLRQQQSAAFTRREPPPLQARLDVLVRVEQKVLAHTHLLVERKVRLRVLPPIGVRQDFQREIRRSALVPHRVGAARPFRHAERNEDVRRQPARRAARGLPFAQVVEVDIEVVCKQHVRMPPVAGRQTGTQFVDELVVRRAHRHLLVLLRFRRQIAVGQQVVDRRPPVVRAQAALGERGAQPARQVVRRGPAMLLRRFGTLAWAGERTRRACALRGFQQWFGHRSAPCRGASHRATVARRDAPQCGLRSGTRPALGAFQRR